jgi:HAD superfamily hydrolase (TIGR01548 family)
VTKGVLILDMDGVLVDVTESYRETIVRTVEHFTGQRITNDFIQDFKNRGGFNDDFILSHQISRDLGSEAPYEAVVERFQSIFLGKNNDGLILRERWVPANGLFDRLAGRWRFAIFTGRTRAEARLTLNRFAPQVVFDPLIGNQEVENQKPAPDGLLRIRAAWPQGPAVYVGDSVDDARSARAAGVPFIGIASTHNPRHSELAELFIQERALAVIPSINELGSVLP